MLSLIELSIKSSALLPQNFDSKPLNGKGALQKLWPKKVNLQNSGFIVPGTEMTLHFSRRRLTLIQSATRLNWLPKLVKLCAKFLSDIWAAIRDPSVPASDNNLSKNKYCHEMVHKMGDEKSFYLFNHSWKTVFACSSPILVSSDFKWLFCMFRRADNILFRRCHFIWSLIIVQIDFM